MVTCICILTDKKLSEFASRAKKDVQISRIAECTCHEEPCFLLRAKIFAVNLTKHMTADVSHTQLIKLLETFVIGLFFIFILSVINFIT